MNFFTPTPSPHTSQTSQTSHTSHTSHTLRPTPYSRLDAKREWGKPPRPRCIATPYSLFPTPYSLLPTP
ncbi:MAG: hypothetical protein F6K50_02065 [Moorea sp. SIO3I7]|nr:hypothetical protein [Moorena sp. SIO3I7]